MTIQDETRFRHLAACITTAAQHLQVDEKPNPQDLTNISAWADAMFYLTQKDTSRKSKKGKN